MKRYALLLLPLLSATALAQTSTSQPEWSRLSNAQKETLIAPLRERWDSSPPEERARMLEHAQHWQSMPAEQRNHARHGMRRFDAMTPEQRDRARFFFAYTRDMPPQERARFQQRWREMTPAQRNEWIRSQPQPSNP
ncbi:MAG: DUF3106 domain-containing protein [Xanthomonadaceae bacterium]|jgi:hypothetical protein|nr:DUF3106 domain-containing protein [Xanthomonadaceae bacterium]